MKTLTPKIFAPFAMALALGLALGLAMTGTASAQACLDKREIQDAVSSGQILSLDAVLASAGVDGNADILSVQVCDEGSGLVYIIGVLSPNGDAQNLVLRAQ